MNLEGLVSGNGLQQDEWSLSAPTFGENNQLKVVGFFWNTTRKNKIKSYVLKCSACSEDPELFGEGYFKSDKGDIIRNMIPCGCAKLVKWSKEQYSTLCQRKAEELGYKFLGFEGDWNQRETKVVLLCNDHGEWNSGSIGNLINSNRGCPACGRDKAETARRTPLVKRLEKLQEVCSGTTCSMVSVPDDYSHVFTEIVMECSVHGRWNTTMKKVTDGHLCFKCASEARGASRRIPDDKMILKFMNTGAFAEGTVFSRLGYRDNGKSEWTVTCPDCKQSGVSTLDNLQQGKRPCACSPMRQQECYINLICDADNTLALKFGIANNSLVRLAAQDRVSVYDIKPFSIYTFPDVASCKKAEQDCKKELETGVILKRDMPDGYTETTYVYNLDKIKQIYKKHGGVET